MASEYLDFLVVAAPNLKEIKDHTLITTHLFLAMLSLRNVSTIHKKLFSTGSVKFCYLFFILVVFIFIIFITFFRPQNTWILSFLVMLVWERSRAQVLDQKICKNIFCSEVSNVYLFYVKKNIFDCIREIFLSLGPKIFGLVRF